MGWDAVGANAVVGAGQCHCKVTLYHLQKVLALRGSS